MKRFLRKVGLLTAAVMMLSSGVAFADDAQPSHGWMRSAPNDDFINILESGARTDDILRRNQTLYWAIKSNDGATGRVIDTSGAAPAEKGCTIGVDCASAPLFISAPTAIICVDTDLATVGVNGGTDISLKACSDSICTDKTSVNLNGVVDTAAFRQTGQCEEFSGAEAYDGFNIGSMWIYIEADVSPASGATTLVWVIGN